MTDKYKEYIEECKNEMSNKLDNNTERIALSDKLLNISKLFDDIIHKKCSQQYDRMKLVSKTENKNDMLIHIPVEGNEREATQALNDLRECIGDLRRYPLNVQNLLNLSDYVMSYQIESCISDCIKNEGDSKPCIKDCYDKSYKYTVSVFNEFIDSQVSSMEDELKKL
jgi:hypothetical protein